VRHFIIGSDHVTQIGLETDQGSDRIKAAFGVNYDRLVVVKNKYNPMSCSAITRTLSRQCSEQQ
jgi:hypothetical protein